MSQEPLAGLLRGTVEVDETYVGGKPRRRSGNYRVGRGTKKVPVMALVERGGRAHSHKVSGVDGETLKGAVRKAVDQSARIMTDELTSYHGLATHFEGGHQTVNHSQEEYVRGEASTNEVESYFALLKRGIMGSFHHVSEKHLNRYCDEFSYRWSHRKTSDGQRTIGAIKGGEGKRLMYKEPVAKTRSG